MEAKQKIIQALTNYKSEYVNAATEMNRVAASGDYTEEYKSRKYQEIAESCNAKLFSIKEQLATLAEEQKEHANTCAYNELSKGLEQSNETMFVVKAIEVGGISPDDLHRLLPKFEGNTVALGAIKRALLNREDDDMRYLGTDIQTFDYSGEVALIDKFANTFKALPILGYTPTSDPMQALYEDGTGFDSTIEAVKAKMRD